MKIINIPVVFIIILLFILSGCSMKKDSLGSDDEIRIICSKIDKKILEVFFANIFNDTIYTPDPEPLYKILFYNPKNYDKLKNYSQIIVASVTRNEKNIGYRLVKKLLPESQSIIKMEDNPLLLSKNLFAKNQLYIAINAQNKDHLFKHIDRNRTLLRKHFDEQFKSRSSKFLFEGRNNTDYENQIRGKYNWDIKIPWGWEVLEDDTKTKFVWIGGEYPYRWVSVQFYKGNIIEDELFVGNSIWNYPVNNYKTIKFNDFKFDMKKIYFNQYKGWQASGVWESTLPLEAKGGPFRSYIFYDDKSDRTFHINTLIHNPGKKKALYIKQMELIAKSFKVI